MADAVAARLRCVVVTPEGQLADREADFIVLTAHDGQFGILPERSPLVCKLAPGLLRVDRRGESACYFVAGGFAEVLDNRVTVLTTQATAAADIDRTAAEHELASAQGLPAKTEPEHDHREQALRVARARLAVLQTRARIQPSR